MGKRREWGGSAGCRVVEFSSTCFESCAIVSSQMSTVSSSPSTPVLALVRCRLRIQEIRLDIPRREFATTEIRHSSRGTSTEVNHARNAASPSEIEAGRSFAVHCRNFSSPPEFTPSLRFAENRTRSRGGGYVSGMSVIGVMQIFSLISFDRRSCWGKSVSRLNEGWL